MIFFIIIKKLKNLHNNSAALGRACRHYRASEALTHQPEKCQEIAGRVRRELCVFFIYVYFTMYLPFQLSFKLVTLLVSISSFLSHVCK